MKSFQLRRQIRGRLRFPDYKIQLDESGQLHLEGSIPLTDIQHTETHPLDESSWSQVRGLIALMDWNKAAIELWGGETESHQSFLELTLANGQTVKVRDDQGGFGYFFNRTRQEFAWMEEYWSVEEIDWYYRYCLFLFHLEKELGVADFLEAHFPEEMEMFRRNALRRYDNKVPESVPFS